MRIRRTVDEQIIRDADIVDAVLNGDLHVAVYTLCLNMTVQEMRQRARTVFSKPDSYRNRVLARIKEPYGN